MCVFLHVYLLSLLLSDNWLHWTWLDFPCQVYVKHLSALVAYQRMTKLWYKDLASRIKNILTNYNNREDMLLSVSWNCEAIKTYRLQIRKRPQALKQAGITMLPNCTAFTPSDTAILHHASQHQGLIRRNVSRVAARSSFHTWVARILLLIPGVWMLLQLTCFTDRIGLSVQAWSHWVNWYIYTWSHDWVKCPCSFKRWPTIGPRPHHPSTLSSAQRYTGGHIKLRHFARWIMVKRGEEVRIRMDVSVSDGSTKVCSDTKAIYRHLHQFLARAKVWIWKWPCVNER